MKLSDSDSGSSNGRSDNRLIRVDIENAAGRERVTQPRSVIHIWKVPLPLRREKVVSDLVKNLACISTLL